MTNYFDKQGNYINCENLSLAEIYHRAFALGVESVAIEGKVVNENLTTDRPQPVGISDRLQGEWIEENSETGAIGIKYTWVRCNQCGWNNSLVIPKNFCPNCGADMRGDTNGEIT